MIRCLLSGSQYTGHFLCPEPGEDKRLGTMHLLQKKFPGAPGDAAIEVHSWRLGDEWMDVPSWVYLSWPPYPETTWEAQCADSKQG